MPVYDRSLGLGPKDVENGSSAFDLTKKLDVRNSNEFCFVCDKLRFIFHSLSRNVPAWSSEIYRASEALCNAGF